MDLTQKIRGFVLLTDTESRILFASDDVHGGTGFDVPEMIGKRPAELWGGRMPKPYYDNMWGRLSKGLSYADSVVNRKKNGDNLEALLSIAPLRDERGNIAGYMALQPGEEATDFFDEFFRATAPDADPVRFQQLLETRFDWELGEQIEGRTKLIEALDQTLADPIRHRFRARTEDADLVSRAKHDGEVFGEFVAKYQGILRRFFRHRLSDPERAEDLVQETFERAFRALHAFQSGNASYQTYLLRIAHNLLVSEYRRHEPVKIEEASTWRSYVGKLEAKDEVERAMESLNEKDREILRLYYKDGYSVREIAGRWSTTENAVKLRLSRARRRLARNLGRASKGVA